MKREFTGETYDYFCRLISQSNDEKWSGISDWFGDIYYDVKHWFGELGLYNYTNNLEKYHKEVLDKKNTAKSEIRRIFEEVSKVDAYYSSDNASCFGNCKNAFQSFQEYIKSLTQISVSGYNAIYNGGNLNEVFNSSIIDVKMTENSVKLSNLLTAGLLATITHNSKNFKNIPSEIKAEYVKAFESTSPEIKNDLKKVLSDPDLTSDEKRDIKFLIYSSPEPYRSIYLEHIKKYKIAVFNVGESDGDNFKGSLYTSDKKKIYLIDSDDTFINNSIGPYTTFFHESGHAIDNFEKSGHIFYSNEYEYNNKKLNDWIKEDTRNYVSKHIDSKYPNLSKSQKDDLMKSLNLTDDATFDYQGNKDKLDKKLKKYHNEIVKDFNNDLKGKSNAAASDVYGGITNNALNGGFGHFAGKDEKAEDFKYWYSNGKATNKQTSELWAEFFAAKMINDIETLESIEKHFPNSYKAMEQMAQDMIK